jgi:hypothetical protein
MEITEAIARRVLEVVDAGLTVGIGSPTPGQMCVEAAVCFALDEPHGDNPSCVALPVRNLKTRLNDSRWSSDMARAKGLRRVAIAQLGTNNAIDETEFIRRVLAISGIKGSSAWTASEMMHAAAYKVSELTGPPSTAGDRILSAFAENIVQILIELKSPGCQWLYLTEAA